MGIIQICEVCGMSVSFLDTSTGKREFCHICGECDKFKEHKLVIGSHKECYKPEYVKKRRRL